MPEDIVLKIENVSKSFGAIKALRGVDFELRRGEIHAIAGENGAGKSTLMNIIDGILRPDSGEIILNGKAVEIGSPARAQELGIGFVHQEIALCPDVTVAENILMADINRSSKPFMDFRALESKARRALEQLSPIDPTVLVRTLSISVQQLVEIAKALTLDCQILILDEPTAALTEREAQVLFSIMDRLAARGMSMIYISHRMVEIFEHCHRVSVFRDGKRIMTADVASVTPDDVVNSMVGRVLGSLYPPKQAPEERQTASLLDIRGLTDGDRFHDVSLNLKNGDRFHDVSLNLKKGEILGIAGLIGAGRSEIVQGICGLIPTSAGERLLEGRRLLIDSYRDSIDQGIVYLSEDRKREGVFLDLSIASNVSALDLNQVSTAWGTIDRRREVQQANGLGDRLGLKRAGIDYPVSSLSGGNQQKVAIAKMLSVAPRVIFLDEPTRGVDVQAKSEIHRILRELARSGVGIVVISSELPELIGLCDRVLVVREGLINGEVEGDEITEENIIRLASFTERFGAAASLPKETIN
jgi:ribose transport system ATP-binding protein